MAIFNTVYGGSWWGYKTFTISWEEKSDMSSGWTYSDDAAWLTAGSTAFDDFFWYSWVRLSTAGVETATVSQSSPWTLDITQLWTLTSGDNVMIKFPLLWIKMSKSWSVVTLSITNNPNAEWFQYYAHSVWTLSNPWTPKDAFYVWVYKGYVDNNVLKSWSWKTITRSLSQSAFCTDATANGSGYNIIWFYQRQFINCLYMMKYWNPNCQSVIWAWYTNWSSIANTWWTNGQTSATYWTSSATVQAKLFWLEDYWGNGNERLWWVYTDGSKNLCTKLSWFNGAVSWWESTGSTVWTTSGNDISSIVWNNKALFWPNATVSNWSYNTYYCDGTTINASAIWTTCWHWINTWVAGVFRIALDVTNTSYNDSTIGTRLMYMQWL